LIREPTAMRRVCFVSGLGLLAVVLAVTPVLAQEKLPDRRTVRGGAPIVSANSQDPALRQNLLELLQQIEALQTEVRELRNTVDVQGHELEQLKSRQRALYDDLDRRLREAEKPRATAPAPAATASPEPAPGGARTISTSQQQEYDAAFGLMKQGLYEKAIKAFRAFVAKYPQSGLSENAQYWIAEGNYVLRNYKLALEEFAKVLSYPQSAKAPDALLKIGYVHYELGAYDKARKALTDVQERYPGTSVARLAATRLDRMKKEGR
jgi:tol-pal system protein YbgF